jgi:HD-like signal output (HDOD) protein
MSLHYFPGKYLQIVEKLQFIDCKKSMAELEKETIGVSSSDLGGYLLNTWSLPYPIVECALFHLEPTHPAIIDRHAVGAVHIAAHYAWKHIYPQLAGKLNDAALSSIGIDAYRCEALFGKLVSQ